MSTAILERVAEQTRKPDLVLVSPAPVVAEKEPWDPHPLLPVFVAGAISLMLAGLFVGSILLGLALRHSGVMAQ
jgi:hypothetical protein